MIEPRASRLFAVVVFGLLSLISGVVRLRQIETHLTPAQISFGPVMNNVTWNSATGELRATGGDPYTFFQIPADSLPLDQLTFECSGKPLSGTSFIYHSPAFLPDFVVDDRLTVGGTTLPATDGYKLHFDLRGTKMVRLDLPDDFANALIIRRITLTSHFIVGDNPTFRVFAFCFGGFLVSVFWFVTGEFIARSVVAEVTAIAVLVALKLWLSTDLHMTVFANAQHDDALFINQGHSIANGDWLGKYGQLTLAKGPTYSVFIALVQLSRIPLLDAQAMLHAIACVLVVLALRPLVDSAGVRLLLLGLLLLDPHQFSSESGERALRSGIQPALTLLTLAGFIGVRTRLDRPISVMVFWSLFAGASLSGFWFSREEGVWLVPTLVLITGSAFWDLYRRPVNVRMWRMTTLVVPAFVCVSALWVLRAVNHHYYGSWISVDVKDGGLPQAYGALTRITPAVSISGVPVTQETRLRAYEVSPAFAELRGSLEGAVGAGWAKYGWNEVEGHPATGKEIRGGWFPWALRQAASDAGHYVSAEETSRYWQRVANEINSACDSGKLQSVRKRSGFAPRIDSSIIAPIGQSVIGAADVVIRFSDYKTQSYLSTGDPVEIARLGRILHEEPVVGRRPPTLRTHLRILLFHCYQNSGVAATVLALCATLTLWIRTRSQAFNSSECVILAGLIGGVVSLMLIVSLVDVTSFRALYSAYLSPATPPILAAWILGPYWALQHASRRH